MIQITVRSDHETSIDMIKPPSETIHFLMCGVKDSFINLDKDLLKVVKFFGQVEFTVQDEITQKWI